MLSVYERLITRFDGEQVVTVPLAAVAVTDLNGGGGLASLFSDRDGVTGISNPTAADANGNVKFYVEPGRYDIDVSYTGGSKTYNDVIVSESGGQVLLDDLLAGTALAASKLYTENATGDAISITTAQVLALYQAATALVKTTFANGNLFTVVDHSDSNNIKGITPTNLFPNKATPVAADKFLILDSESNDEPASTTSSPSDPVWIAEPTHTDHLFTAFDAWETTAALSNGVASKVNIVRILMPQATDNTTLWIAGDDDTRTTGAGVDGQEVGRVTSGSIGNNGEYHILLDSAAKLQLRCNNRIITVKFVVVGYLP